MSENLGVDIAFHDVPVALVLMFCRLIDQKDNRSFWKSIRNALELAAELLEAAKSDPDEMYDKDTARWMSGLADLAHEMAGGEEAAL
ncbi:MAG: hypothetical protein V3S14_10835 [Anaerolineae bacterium]